MEKIGFFNGWASKKVWCQTAKEDKARVYAGIFGLKYRRSMNILKSNDLVDELVRSQMFNF